jgi:hypothetical protein
VTFPAAPAVFGADQLRDDIRDDLEARGFVADWLVGEWNTERHYGTTRVVIGLGRAQVQSAADTMHGTDGWHDIGGGQVAAARLARVHTFPIWIHGYASAQTINTDPANVAEEARRVTLALLDAVTAAVERERGGLPLLPWPVEPLSEERGDFVDGSVMRLDVQIAVPIFDDPSDTITPDEMHGAASLDLDGTITPATPETQTAP